VGSASHTVQRQAAVGVERLFDTVVAEDVLPRVLRRWGPVPAVTGTRDLSGPWDTPGSSRTVLLADGNTVREQVVGWERPRRFEYRVDRFTSTIARFVEYATGKWEFAATPGGARFTWTYTFTTRDTLSARLMVPFVHAVWGRYMAQCADLCARLAAADAAPEG
jgi:hypothetical protein